MSIESEKRVKRNADKIRGALAGCAAGDALGYAVEFMFFEQIADVFGPAGITTYATDNATRKALISDDTQMALFTANGILVGETRLHMRGIGANPHVYVAACYQDWLDTQHLGDTRRTSFFSREQRTEDRRTSWLLDVPELHHPRAPGGTCLSALQAEREGQFTETDFIRYPRNDSKGCGGVMRVAPLALHYGDADLEELDKEGAMIAAITHGHPLGYMPAAVLTHILSRIVYPKEKQMTLEEIVGEAKETTQRIFADHAYLSDLCRLIDLAVELSKNSAPDRENFRFLGEGWVAEETLAIAIYCALKYENDFDGALIASVNHDGDSDSTGAVTGQIMGALFGYDNIPDKWKAELEILDVILEMADDLAQGFPEDKTDSAPGSDWYRKYVEMTR